MTLDWLTLPQIAKNLREWQDHTLKDMNKLSGALALCEEAGEVARYVTKEHHGIRPESRGDIEKELGDVFVTALALCDRYDLVASDVIEKRYLHVINLEYDDKGEKK